MMPRSKFILRRRVWTKSCAELGSTQARNGVVEPAYLSNGSDRKKTVEKRVKREKPVHRRVRSGPTPAIKQSYNDGCFSSEPSQRTENDGQNSRDSSAIESHSRIPILPGCSSVKHVHYNVAVVETRARGSVGRRKEDEKHWKAKVGKERGRKRERGRQ